MQIVVFMVSAIFLLTAAYLVFHRVVAKDYQEKGRLGWLASLLQLVVFFAFFCFPYIYMPKEWAWDWMPNGTWNRLVALTLVCIGMVLAFGTMFWFGLGRAFGLTAKGLVTTGLYRFSRNPQMIGGWVMVIGVFFYLPSLYNLGWVVLWAFIGHWMVTNEEICMRRVYGEEYEQYCKKTPRYLFWI